MSVLRVVEPVEPPSGDAVVARLEICWPSWRRWWPTAARCPMRIGSTVGPVGAGAGGDRAVQAAEMVRFAQSQVAEQLAAEVHPRRIGQGIADQIALACRVSPWEGSRRLGVARALWFDLPQTYAQLTRGSLSERVAEQWSPRPGTRTPSSGRAVDAAVNAAGIEKMGVRPRRSVPASMPTRRPGGLCEAGQD